MLRCCRFLRRLCSSASPLTTPLDESTVLATLSLYTDDWRRALDFYHWSSSPLPSSPSSPAPFRHTPSTLARIVDILGKHFEFSVAFSLLHSYPSPLPLLALRSLLNRLAAARLLSDAVDAFSRFSPSLASFHLLLDSLSDHRLVADAEHLLLSPSPPFPPDTKSFNILLRGWSKLRRWSRCRQLWLDMDSRRIAKDLHSYAVFMDAMAKSGKPWKSIQLFKQLKSRRIVPDAVVYNVAIKAVSELQGPDLALRLYREMLDAGIPANTATFNTIVRLLCKEGRFREAYVFVGKMRKAGLAPDALTYHCFFQHLTRPQEILLLFERMSAVRCRPRMDTYVMLIKKFGRWGFLRPVFLVWRKMEEEGRCPDAFAYEAMIDALRSKGMVEMARKYEEEMLAKGLAPKPRCQDLGTQWPPQESASDELVAAESRDG